jgi:hypothetical protein
MYEYLAYIAATTGRLVEALRRDGVDRELLTAAGEILEALVMGGPAEDLDDYEDGADAVEAYLDQIRARAETPRDFHAVAAIMSFLSQDSGWDERAHRGWTATRREAFEDTCEEIVARDQWDDLIDAGLQSQDLVEFGRASQAARRRGVDTFEIHVGGIQQDPYSGNWFDAWRQADRERAERLVELVRTLLPIDEIPTGPSDALGLGPEWRPHAALDWTLQALRDHVAVGADLVLIGLQSPVTRNRNMALNVLKEWPRSTWPAGAIELAENLEVSDPNQQTRELASEVRRRA